MVFCEVGHFYMDEQRCSLEYLRGMEIPQNSRKALFIDDYNATNSVLDLSSLHSAATRIIGDVEIHFEGDMVQYYDDVVNLFTDNDLVITKYRRNTIEKLELALGDRRITLAEIHPTFKPTCAFLSLSWTLYRMGVIGDSQCNKAHTIIDLKYKPIELKVTEMIEYLSTKHNRLHSANHTYQYFGE